MATRARFSEADWAALKDEMRAILIGLARARQTIAYSDLAGLLTSAYVHHRAPDFHRLITDMSQDDERAGRASLAALVVRKDSGVPGAGFFAHTPVDGATMAEMEAYWRAEFERTCDFWSDDARLP